MASRKIYKKHQETKYLGTSTYQEKNMEYPMKVFCVSMFLHILND